MEPDERIRRFQHEFASLHEAAGSPDVRDLVGVLSLRSPSVTVTEGLLRSWLYGGSVPRPGRESRVFLALVRSLRPVAEEHGTGRGSPSPREWGALLESAQSATGSEARVNNTLGGDNSGMSNQFGAMYGNVNTTNIYGVEPPVDTRERRRGKGHLGRRGLVVAVVCLLVAAAVPLLLEAWGDRRPDTSEADETLPSSGTTAPEPTASTVPEKGGDDHCRAWVSDSSREGFSYRGCIEPHPEGFLVSGDVRTTELLTEGGQVTLWLWLLHIEERYSQELRWDLSRDQSALYSCTFTLTVGEEGVQECPAELAVPWDERTGKFSTAFSVTHGPPAGLPREWHSPGHSGTMAGFSLPWPPSE